MRKNNPFLVICLLCVMIFFCGPLYAAPVSPEQLIAERTSVCYIDGQVFEGLVLGATGMIEFVYLDSKLVSALRRAHQDLVDARASNFPFPAWIEEGNYQTTSGKKGYAMFVARLEAFKPWNVDPELIFVGGSKLNKRDVATSSMTNPFGEVPSGEQGTFVFAVPQAEVKAGREISIGYGEFSVKWRVPK